MYIYMYSVVGGKCSWGDKYRNVRYGTDTFETSNVGVVAEYDMHHTTGPLDGSLDRPPPGLVVGVVVIGGMYVRSTLYICTPYVGREGWWGGKVHTGTVREFCLWAAKPGVCMY